MRYNWEQPDWPSFTQDLSAVQEKLYLIAEKTGAVGGVLKALPPELQLSAIIDTMVNEAVKTSEIEGELLSREDVMSSIRNNLGVNEKPEKVKDKRVKGLGKLMAAVRNSFAAPLDEHSLFSWHRMLMDFDPHVSAGRWRASIEPMQVVSGPAGREKVHFEATPSKKVPQEMRRFISWFNNTAPGGSAPILQAPVRSAIAHLYFETIHPFEDGNGRIGRAIAEKALSQGIGRPVLLSLSRSIQAKRSHYYDALKAAQRSNTITAWIGYFLDVIIAAQTDAEKLVDFSLKKARFFDRFRDRLSERQGKVIGRMLEEGPKGFTGGMNARKYSAITKASKATATRALQELLAMKAVVRSGDGRREKHRVLTEPLTEIP